jgi:hypothetical protein
MPSAMTRRRGGDKSRTTIGLTWRDLFFPFRHDLDRRRFILVTVERRQNARDAARATFVFLDRRDKSNNTATP